MNGAFQPSLAGWWLALVSLPVFQFLWLRWYFRMFIWARFLWQVSRIKLKFMPTHPDRCGGLGFLAGVSYAFSPVLMAQGALLAGMMANRIFYAGATLPEFKVELIGLVAVMLFAVLGPMLVFSVQLEHGQARRPARARHPGAALRAGVRPQVAARRRAAGRAVHRQRRHSVAGRPGQQLRSGQGDAVGAVHDGHGLPVGRDHAGPGRCR